MCGLRPTRQRVGLASQIVGVERHFTAEELHREVVASGHELSLGTVYNTLQQFERMGLVRELVLEGMKAVYDSDTSRHHHFHVMDEDSIIDIPAGALVLRDLPPVPDGYEVNRVEVIVRLRRIAPAHGPD